MLYHSKQTTWSFIARITAQIQSILPNANPKLGKNLESEKGNHQLLDSLEKTLEEEEYQPSGAWKLQY